MSQKKKNLLLPLGFAAAGALAVGAVVLSRRPKAAAPAGAPAAAPAPSAALRTGSYSFVSGFQNAATVELTLRYDPECSSFEVVAEDFLSYSSASHVGIYRSEVFNAQIESVPYYAGEDFEAFTRALAEKHRGVAPVRYAALSGVRYEEGDAICLCFPIPEDSSSYLFFSLFKVEKDDEPLSALPDKPAVRALLDTAEIKVTR